MIDLNKQIGPFPLKMWLIIGVGGIGIGYLVTRNPSAKQGSIPTNNQTDVSAINQLSNKITTLSLANESVMNANDEQTGVLQSLTNQLALLQTNLANVDRAIATQPTKPSGSPITTQPIKSTGIKKKITSGPGTDVSLLIKQSGLSFYDQTIDKYGNTITSLI